MEPEEGTIGEQSIAGELKRSERKNAKRNTKLPIVIVAALALTVILALGAFFIFKPFSLPQLLNADTHEADIDAEIAYLLERTPELFTDAYGGHDAEELRSRIAASNKDRDLLVKEARRRGITDVGAKVDASFSSLKGGYAVRQEFEKLLIDRGITEAQLKAALEANILINELAKDLVKESDITEDAAQAYFEANISRYASKPSRKISHILFASNDTETAATVHSQIVSGGDFAALAKEHSKDSGSAARGGDIGWSTSTYPDTFQEAVDSLSVGEVSAPTKTKYGIHIITVTDIRDGTSSFEEVKGQVIADLLGKKRAEAIDNLLQELKG